MKTKKLYSETTSFHLSHNRKSPLKHDMLSVPWIYQCFRGIFLSVTNKMVESLLQCQTFSQMFFHIIEKVRILIYLKQSLKQ